MSVNNEMFTMKFVLLLLQYWNWLMIFKITKSDFYHFQILYIFQIFFPGILTIFWVEKRFSLEHL